MDNQITGVGDVRGSVWKRRTEEVRPRNTPVEVTYLDRRHAFEPGGTECI
jgi:hypothetical protein